MREKRGTRALSFKFMNKIGKRSTRALMLNRNGNLLASKRSTRILTSNIKGNLLKSRCSQEEMIGFVLIIILVAIIALIFLAISIKPGKMQENKEIENFLHASLLYTTQCKESPEITYDFGDLIKACSNNEKCLDGKEACEVLGETASNLIEKSFKVGEKEKYKGYMFKVYGENNALLEINEGEKSMKKTGSKVLISDIYMIMELFY